MELINRNAIFSEKKCKLNPKILEFSILKEQGKYHEIWEVADFLYVLLCSKLNGRLFWEMSEFIDYEHFHNWVTNNHYQFFNEERIDALVLKNKLMRKYKDVSIEDHFDGKVVEIKDSQCYYLEFEQKIEPLTVDYPTIKRNILNDLTLIHGIGPHKEEKLKSKKMITIEDLATHNKYGQQAIEILGYFGTENYQAFARWIDNRRKIAKSDPKALAVSQYLHKQFVFLDIENLGFPDLPIILIGIGIVENKKLIVKQYLVREPEEEVGVLHAILNELNDNSVIVSFNGRAFDVPVINARLEKKDIQNEITNLHYDLYWFSRRAWKGKLQNCKLPTIEKEILKIKRKNDIPSYMVPDFYYEYLETKNIGLLIPIIQHNVTDIVSLYDLYRILKDILI